MSGSKKNWLRAAVLGANDGILSTAGLLVGVTASNLPPAQILITGAAGLFAGALSMAAGEYVSVSSQSDVERAQLARERRDDARAEREAKVRPLQAALASAASYATGAALPLTTASLAAGAHAAEIISGASLISLAALGAIAARVSGANPVVGAARVTFWGAFAMAITATVGHYFGGAG